MAPFVIDTTQWFNPAVGISGQDTAGVKMGTGGEKLFEYILVEGRHITGNNQVMVRSGVRQRGFDSRKRPLAGKVVGHDRKAEAGVARRVTHDVNGAKNSNLFSNMEQQRMSFEFEQGFVSTHTATFPPSHDPRRVSQMVLSNIIVRFCFILMLGMPAIAAHITTVVHADLKSGKLVRSVTPAQIPVDRRPVQTKEDITGMIDRIAHEQGVETPLVHSVIKTESNYNPAARSPKGAQGMMQLIPATAKRFGVTDALDAQDNIQGGVRYLRFLLDYYHNDYVKAIAAYNAGEGAVDRYNGIPPYAETQNYVLQVARNLKKARAVQRVIPVVQAAATPETETAETIHPIIATLGPDGRTYYRTP